MLEGRHVLWGNMCVLVCVSYCMLCHSLVIGGNAFVTVSVKVPKGLACPWLFMQHTAPYMQWEKMRTCSWLQCRSNISCPLYGQDSAGCGLFYKEEKSDFAFHVCFSWGVLAWKAILSRLISLELLLASIYLHNICSCINIVFLNILCKQYS